MSTEERHIAGVFVFFKGEDPTYRIIREGSWHRNSPYGVIHRVASDGSIRCISKFCFDFAKENCDYLRIDTHKDNIPKQNTLAKNGFRRCGIIDTYSDTNDGSPRIAYDWEAREENLTEENFIMKRNDTLEEISDGNLYEANDMV